MAYENTVAAVLITGASSGIGRETALAFAESGCRLALAARGAEKLNDVGQECLRAGATDVLVRPTDISRREQVRALFDAASERFGGLDIVVQNAGVAAFGSFLDVPADVFDAVIRVNVLGAADVVRAALHHFVERERGQLVVVGSTLGQVAVPYLGAYVMSKFAVTALVRVLRQETRGLTGIAVHGIYPGAVDTPIYGQAANFLGRCARVLPVKDSPAKVARRIVSVTRRGRGGERQVGLANLPLLAADRLLPRVFDALVGPLIKLGGFTRESLPDTTGNVFDESPSERTAQCTK
jgi:short-subunit dehydrogenase